MHRRPVPSCAARVGALLAGCALLVGCAAGQPARDLAAAGPAPATTTQAAIDRARATPQPARPPGAPTGMTIPQGTKFPATVGDYDGRHSQQGWDYANPDTGRRVSVVHPAGAFTWDNTVTELAGTDRALGHLGACGYRGGTGGAPMCILRVSDGSVLRLLGDSGMTYGQVVAFATEYAAAAGA